MLERAELPRVGRRAQRLLDTDSIDRLLAAGAKTAGDVTLTPSGDEMTFLRDPWGVALQLVKRATPLMG